MSAYLHTTPAGGLTIEGHYTCISGGPAELTATCMVCTNVVTFRWGETIAWDDPRLCAHVVRSVLPVDEDGMPK